MISSLRSRPPVRRGAAVVELAVIAPLLIVLVFGTIEYGRMIQVQQIVTNAAREGARLGVQSGTTVSQVQAKVSNYLQNVGIDGETVTVTPNPLSGAASGSPVTVKVQITFSRVSWLPAPMYLKSFTISATSVMRRPTY